MTGTETIVTVNADAAGWRIDVADKPVSLNVERQGNRYTRHKHTDKWKAYGHEAAMRLRTKGAIPHAGMYEVTSTMFYRNRAAWFDVGNWWPGVKALQDGMVEAGLLPGDAPKNCGRLEFVHGGVDRDGLTRVVVDVVLL